MARAGEFAPEITVTKVLRSPGGAGWTHDKLVGGLTVLEFYPKLSHSQIYRVHNRRVEQYAGANVQFVCIVRDEETNLQRWLEKCPVHGWLLLDSNWDTARAWGMRLPQTAFIDSSGSVLGFSRHDDDTEWQIEEIVAGRVESAHLKPQSDFHEILTPALPPSQTVHIAPAQNASGTHSAVAPDYWVALGFTLRELLAMAWQVHESDLNLAPVADTGTRYDVRLVLPAEQKPEAMAARVQRALEQYFGLEVSHEIRPVDVYVMTAPRGTVSSRSQGGDVGWAVHSMPKPSIEIPQTGKDIENPDFPFPMRRLSAIGKGFEGHGPMLRLSRGWLMVDDSDREGYCGIDVTWMGNETEELLLALREELGIVVTREEIEILAIRGASVLVE